MNLRIYHCTVYIVHCTLYLHTRIYRLYLEPAVWLVLPSTWSQQSVWSYLPPGASSLSAPTFHLEPAVCLLLPSTWSQQSVCSYLPPGANSLSGPSLHSWRTPWSRGCRCRCRPSRRSWRRGWASPPSPAARSACQRTEKDGMAKNIVMF